MEIINTYFSNLKKQDELYFSDSKTELSYPSEGNQIYFDVEETSFWFKHRNTCIATLVKKYSPESLFFDIGGGNGYVSHGLIKEGIQTVLIEPGIQGCINAKKRGVKQIICSTLEESGCKKNSLPAVGLFDVVEHIEKDDAFIKTISEHLQNDGYLYVTVPSFSFLWSSEDELAGHFRRYSLSQIEDLLISNGYKIHFSSYLFSFLPIPILIKRTLLGKFKPRKNTSLNTVKNEHGNENGFVTFILKKLLSREKKKISKGKKINFGSSCILVAQKINH